MPKLLGLLSKLKCYHKHKADWESLPSNVDDDRMEFESHGQEVLAALMQRDIGGADISGEEVDWIAGVAKARRIQKEELPQKREGKIGRLKQLKRSLERRMQDGKATFSANMVTYSISEISKSHAGLRRTSRPRRINSTGQILFSSTVDDHSRCSASTRSVHTMHVIDEELEYR